MTTTDLIPAQYVVRAVAAVPHLNGTFYDLVHEPTGARHVHLAVPDRNNSFCVLYRTPPPDSSGVPHIMEHCVSGGSRRFPPGAGGDMYNRSLLTDINGMTQADNTTYYFATRNATDYMNWMEYVVDVSLFPRLEVDTFLKHRGHFELDDDGGLRFVGTVFNEMKAVFGSPRHHEFLALRKALYEPGHPYSFYAAGDPAEMPSLTYEQLLDFNKRHYHPGNATFISRGDVPLDRILAATEEIMGDSFERRAPSEVPDIARWSAPSRLEAAVPSGDGQTTVAWLGSGSTDAYRRLLLELAHDIFFTSPDGAVRRALGGTLTSLVAPLRRVMLVASTTGTDDPERMEASVLEALDVSVDSRTLDDAIARFQLRRREQADALGTYLDAILPAVLYDGDAAEALTLDASRADVADLREAVRTDLVGNAHRALITLHPDAQLEDRVRETEETWLADLGRELTDDRRAAIVAETTRLTTPPTATYERRGLTPDEALSILDAPEPSGVHGPVTFYEQPTGGLTYVRVRIDLSGVPADDIPALRLLADACARDVARSSSRVDGVSGQTHTRVDAAGEKCLHWLEIGLRAREEDAGAIVDAIRTTLGGDSSVDDLVVPARTRIERSVMPDAQVHLRRLAASALRRSALYDEWVRGLSQLACLRQPATIARDALMVTGRVTACVIGERNTIADDLAGVLGNLPAGTCPAAPDDVLDLALPHRARVTQLPVAFTCEAFRVPGLLDPDGPAIAVLTQQMWSGYLNTEIRRGGAYGVDYGVLPGRGLLWISSRRDPLPDNTYTAIAETLRRVAEGEWDATTADDAKLAILRVTDPVDSPAASARRAWNATFTGQTSQLWSAYRRRVLDVSDEDTMFAASSLLGKGSRATLAGRALLDQTGPYDEIEEL